MRFRLITFLWILIICGIAVLGCEKGEETPYPVKIIQVADDYLSKGYDIYLTIALIRTEDARGDRLTELMNYYQRRYQDYGKVKVIIFRDAQSAIQAVSSAVLAELEMENGKVIMKMINVD